MTETESIQKTAPVDPIKVDPIKKLAGWEIFLRCVLVLLGIFLGIVSAFVIASVVGWFQFAC